MLLFVIADFFRRRRRPRRARDEMPAGPLLRVLIFWILFGLGALIGGIAIVAGISGSWIVAAASAAVAIASLVAAIVTWMRLNRLD